MLAVAHASDLLSVFRKHPKMQALELARANLAPTGAVDAPAGADDALADTVMMESNSMIKVPASTLQTLPGFGDLDAKLFEGKTMRQMGRGQVDDEGNDVSGYFIVSDAGALVLFEEHNNACRWANNMCQVNIKIAPSLTYVNSGHPNVSLMKLTKFYTIEFPILIYVQLSTKCQSLGEGSGHSMCFFQGKFHYLSG